MNKTRTDGAPSFGIAARSPHRPRAIAHTTTFDVVPTRADTDLHFTVVSEGELLHTPQWSVSGQGEPRRGETLAVRVNPWKTGLRRWLGHISPQIFTVMVRTEDGRQHAVDVRTYPADRLTVYFDANQWASLQEGWSHVEHALGCWIDGIKLHVCEGYLKFEAGWEECAEDHLAVYKWELDTSFDPLVGVYGRFSLGPLAVLPAVLREHVLDAGAFVDVIGKITTGGKVGRFSNGPLTSTLHTDGVLEVGLGVQAQVLRRVAQVEVVGKTSVIAIADVTDSPGTVPTFGLSLSWDGLKGEVRVKLVGGLSFVTTAALVDPEPIIQKAWPLPLGGELPSAPALEAPP
jgi:hypothetical protein